MQNHFDLFNLPQGFSLDMSTLEKAYHEVQSKVHPDRFAQANDTEKRIAMQWATRVNEAYKTLKSPFRRAAYLCELNGIDLQMESNTAMPGSFLMQQMEWREALEDAKASKNITALEKLESELHDRRKTELAKVADLLNTKDYESAAQGVRQLMFLEKFGDEIKRTFEIIEA